MARLDRAVLGRAVARGSAHRASLLAGHWDWSLRQPPPKNSKFSGLRARDSNPATLRGGLLTKGCGDSALGTGVLSRRDVAHFLPFGRNKRRQWSAKSNTKQRRNQPISYSDCTIRVMGSDEPQRAANSFLFRLSRNHLIKCAAGSTTWRPSFAARFLSKCSCCSRCRSSWYRSPLSIYSCPHLSMRYTNRAIWRAMAAIAFGAPSRGRSRRYWAPR